MSTNVEVVKKNTENNTSLIKRFTRSVQESGVLPRVRSIRYAERPLSAFKKKTGKLKSLANRAKYEELFKMGKISGFKKGRRR